MVGGGSRGPLVMGYGDEGDESGLVGDVEGDGLGAGCRVAEDGLGARVAGDDGGAPGTGG